jgi:hypothetical protein
MLGEPFFVVFAWSRSARYGVARNLHPLQDGYGVLEEYAPRRGKRHAARGPHEQGGGQLVLEAADLPTDRGLRDSKFLCCAADVAFFGNGDEVLDLGEAHGASLPQVGVSRCGL